MRAAAAGSKSRFEAPARRAIEPVSLSLLYQSGTGSDAHSAPMVRFGSVSCKVADSRRRCRYEIDPNPQGPVYRNSRMEPGLANVRINAPEGSVERPRPSLSVTR